MDNIAWIFSGIGISLLAILLSPLRKPVISYMESLLRFIPFVERKQIETWAGIEQYKAEPSPKSIVKQVKKLPPAQREFAEDQYKGLKVSWSLKYHTLFKEDGEKVRLMLRDSSGYPWVYVKVTLNDYPKLKTYSENQVLWVAGTISNVHGHDINLENVILHLF